MKKRERCEYGYTAKSGEELSELDCTHYSYDYTGDRLMSYNGEEFAYNNIGNPTIYRGKTVQWQYGTRLVKLGNTTFAYDGLGRRIKKGNIDFIYDNDGRLISQSTWLEFFYDANGVAGFVFGDKQYFYRKDAQSNIIAILDNTGAVVVRYIYDAWGNHAIVDANGEDITEGLGVLNPFRYRSYYYDTETGLYYLQTRYYDPELGRFISQDSLEYADPETINGLNLYAYCLNNPVSMVDPDGTKAKWWEWLIGIVVIVAAVAISIATVGLATPLAAILGGGIIATIVASAAVGAIGGAVAGFGISVGLQTINNGINNIDWNQVNDDAIDGAISGGVFGGIKYVASASEIASGLSGITVAKQGADKALLVLQNTPIRIVGGVMATDRVAAVLSYNTASATLGSAQSAYNFINFVVTLFYRLTQFGFKQLVHNTFKG